MFERHSAAADHSAELHRGRHPLLLQRAAQNCRYAQERPAHGAGSHVWTEAEGLFAVRRRHTTHFNRVWCLHVAKITALNANKHQHLCLAQIFGILVHL